jgi:glycosyltransferase involved in cell wall biosynthesis
MKKKINVLFCTNSLENVENGPGLFANLLKNSLIGKNKYCSHIDLRILSEDVYKLNSNEKVYSLNLIPTKYNRYYFQFLRIVKYYLNSLIIYKEFKYDIIVYNNAFTGYLSALLSSRKVAVMINDDNRINSLKNSFGFSFNFFKNRILYFLEKYSAINSDAVIINSKYMKSKIQESYELNENKLFLLYKGIELDREPSNNTFGSKANYRVLFVKNDYHRGGLNTLIQALDKLSVKFNFKLTIVGTSTRDMKFVQSLVKESNFEVVITGIISPDQIKSLLNSSDIFCVPSLNEALGVANMEALARGVCVISTNVGGIPEVLDYGKAGWLVNPGKPHLLANAILESIENNDLRLRKKNHAYSHVKQFGSDRLIDNFIDLMNTIQN